MTLMDRLLTAPNIGALVLALISLYLLCSVLRETNRYQDSSAWLHSSLHALKDKYDRRRAYTGGPQPRTLVQQIGNLAVGKGPNMKAPQRPQDVQKWALSQGGRK